MHKKIPDVHQPNEKHAGQEEDAEGQWRSGKCFHSDSRPGSGVTGGGELSREGRCAYKFQFD